MLAALFAGKLVISWSGVLSSQELPSENENKKIVIQPHSPNQNDLLREHFEEFAFADMFASWKVEWNLCLKYFRIFLSFFSTLLQSLGDGRYFWTIFIVYLFSTHRKKKSSKIVCLAPRNIEFVFSQAKSTKWSWEKIKTLTPFVFHYEANNSVFVQQELVKSLCVMVMIKYHYANSMITVLTYLQRTSRLFFRMIDFLTTFHFSVKVYAVQFKSFAFFSLNIKV